MSGSSNSARGRTLRTRFASLLQRHFRHLRCIFSWVLSEKAASVCRARNFELVCVMLPVSLAYYVDDFSPARDLIQGVHTSGKAISAKAPSFIPVGVRHRSNARREFWRATVIVCPRYWLSRNCSTVHLSEKKQATLCPFGIISARIPDAGYPEKTNWTEIRH